MKLLRYKLQLLKIPSKFFFCSSIKHKNAIKVQKYLGENLHLKRNLPIGIVKEKIETFFLKNFSSSKGDNNVVTNSFPLFKVYDKFSPKVSTKENFDNLLIDEKHPSRSQRETFYLNETTVLRTHTTCHDYELIKKGKEAFLVSGDCYRQDAIDSRHFPVFHQTDGVRLFDKTEVTTDYVLDDLKNTLIRLVKSLFGESIKYRWNKDYFPFTVPSLELEIKNNDQWMEVLGCGLLHSDILKNLGKHDRIGWAFGLGLERIAMALFKIPDIRLFHCKDERFSKQFKTGEITKFRPFSKYPACYKDISFWIEDSFSEKEFYSVVKSSAGELLESIKLIDSFSDPVSNRSSRCYRITYRSFNGVLLNKDVDRIQNEVIEKLGKSGSLKLRQ